MPTIDMIYQKTLENLPLPASNGSLLMFVHKKSTKYAISIGNPPVQNEKLLNQGSLTEGGGSVQLTSMY